MHIKLSVMESAKGGPLDPLLGTLDGSLCKPTDTEPHYLIEINKLCMM